ncbi:MAG: phosphohydrolase, partial [Desulfobacteraceae bacterium]|nr:phosphohydrolase [Desulfobacteraceae bacterium]
MKRLLDSENIIFADETYNFEEEPNYGNPWDILIVDDEKDVHKITELALTDYSFKDRKVNLFNAFSSTQAKEILNNENDIALVLLDVVMEQDNAGLNLIDYIRNVLNNQMIRIVIRTGQP